MRRHRSKDEEIVVEEIRPPTNAIPKSVQEVMAAERQHTTILQKLKTKDRASAKDRLDRIKQQLVRK
jgi:hypothetical protein